MWFHLCGFGGDTFHIVADLGVCDVWFVVKPEKFIVDGSKILYQHFVWSEEQGGGAACADADAGAFGKPYPWEVDDGNHFIGDEGGMRVVDFPFALLWLRTADFPFADIAFFKSEGVADMEVHTFGECFGYDADAVVRFRKRLQNGFATAFDIAQVKHWTVFAESHLWLDAHDDGIARHGSRLCEKQLLHGRREVRLGDGHGHETVWFDSRHLGGLSGDKIARKSFMVAD